MLNADEIAGILKQQIASARIDTRQDEVGTVIEVGDSIARVYGLSAVKMMELVQFPNGLFGIAFNLEEDNVGVVIMGADSEIKEGDTVRRTGRIVSVPVGDGVIGRVINPLGQPLDDKGPVNTTRTRPIETQAPSVVQRQPRAASHSRRASKRSTASSRSARASASSSSATGRPARRRSRSTRSSIKRARTSSASTSRSDRRRRRSRRPTRS